MKTRAVQKRSVTVNGHRTSVTLEKEFWDSLKEISLLNKKSVNSIVEEIDKNNPQNLSSAVRVFILNFYITMRT